MLCGNLWELLLSCLFMLVLSMISVCDGNHTCKLLKHAVQDYSMWQKSPVKTKSCGTDDFYLYQKSMVLLLHKFCRWERHNVQINVFAENNFLLYLHIEPETLWHISTGNTDAKVSLYSFWVETLSWCHYFLCAFF